MTLLMRARVRVGVRLRVRVGVGVRLRVRVGVRVRVHVRSDLISCLGDLVWQVELLRRVATAEDAQHLL